MYVKIRIITRMDPLASSFSLKHVTIWHRVHALEIIDYRQNSLVLMTSYL